MKEGDINEFRELNTEYHFQESTRKEKELSKKYDERLDSDYHYDIMEKGDTDEN